jgi:hypothetical protein
MNERIRELAKQLGPDPVGYIGNWGRVEWADNVYPQLGDQMYAAIDLEKFAELIVRECADIAQQHNKSPVAAPLAIGYVIREHFGVEE